MSGELAVTKDLNIEGPGANELTISGNHSSRAFDISGGVTVTIAGLTIANGVAHSDLGGGGILNQDSMLTLSHDDLTGNEALGLGGSSAYVQGGAVNNLADTALTVTDSQFTENRVIGGSGGEGVGGGAIGTLATASVTGSSFTSNLAQAGNGGVAPANAFFTGDVMGGALVSMFGTVTVDQSSFTGNQAIAGSGGSGGSGVFFIDSAYGGALMDCGGAMTVNNSTIDHNLDQGGSDASGGTGLGFIGDANGGGFAGYGTIAFTNSTFNHNVAASGSDNTGSTAGIDASAAYGGAICTDGGGLLGFSDSFTASNLRLTNNQAIGGAGNQAGGNPAGVLVGTGTGGGFMLFDGGTTTATISNSTIVGNQAIGGADAGGGGGADGQGGGLATNLGGNLVVSHCAVEQDQAIGGAGGSAWGGGIAELGDGANITVDHSSFLADTADGDYLAYGGGIGNDGGGSLMVSHTDFVSDQTTAGFGSGGTGDLQQRNRLDTGGGPERIHRRRRQWGGALWRGRRHPELGRHDRQRDAL